MIQSTIDNRTTTHTKTRRMWVFAFIMTIVLSFDGELSAKRLYMQKEEGIDFAYPAEVEKTARLQLTRALKSGDDISALQATIRLTMARNMVNQDKALEGIELLDSLGHTLHHPYSNLALLLEARLYTDMYQANPWVYNRRVIPANKVSANPSEWDKDAYSRKVIGLINEATNGAYGDKVSLSKIGELLQNGDERVVSLLTVADFVDMQSCTLLDVFIGSSVEEIPFYPEEGKGSKTSEIGAAAMKKKLLADLAGRYEGKGLNEASAVVDEFLCNQSYGESQQQEAKKYLAKWESTPWAAPFFLKIGGYADSIEAKKDIYRRISDYLVRFPEAPGAAALESLRERLILPDVTVTTPTQVLPGDSIQGKYTLTNIEKAYILCVRLSASKAGEYVEKKDVMQGSVVARRAVEGLNDSVRPFQRTGDYRFAAQPQGVYVNVVSSSPDLQGLIWSEQATRTVGTYPVSNLATLEMEGEGTDGRKTLIVVDGRNQKPIPNAKVILTSRNSNKPTTHTLTTDTRGEVNLPEGAYEMKIRHGKDFLTGYIYSWLNRVSEHRSRRINLFTDLSIYHPGDSVQFVGVYYSMDNKTLRPEKGEVKVILRDANYSGRDTITLRSDKDGRITGKFRIPSDGLLGWWNLEAQGNRVSENVGFQVAEYKSPSFIVETKVANEDLRAGDMLKLEGEAITYAGMPVGDATVNYEINYVPLYWRGMTGAGNARYGGTTKTDSKGKFTIELPTDNLRNTPYAIGRYRVKVTVTDVAGETQEGTPLWLNIGKAYRIEANLPEYYNLTKSEPLRVEVYNLAGTKVRKHVKYTIYESGKPLYAGEFDAPEFKLPNGIKPCRYKVEFSFEEEGEKASTETDIIVWTEDMKEVPIKTPLWQPLNEIVVGEAERTVRIKVGSGYDDSYLLAVQYGEEGLISQEWIKVSRDIVEIPVKAPGNQQRIKLVCSGMHDLEQVTKTVTLIPEEQLRKLEITTETFRDRLSPGASERWNFRFSYAGKPMAGIPVMAVMTDKSLNSLASFRWEFNPSAGIARYIRGTVEGTSAGTLSWTQWPRSLRNSKGYASAFPGWNFYGYSLYGKTGGGLRIRGASGGMMRKNGAVQAESIEVMLTSAPMMNSASDGAVKDMGAVKVNDVKDEMKAESAEADATETGDADGLMEPLRENEHPLAFFMPMLTTDSEGESELSFKVPDYNGTWQLQVMGYIPEGMIGNVLVKDAVSSRPLMIRLHAPRFVRTGDKAMISATVFNNSPEAVQISGEIEILTPDGTIIPINSADRTFSIEPLESVVLNGEWEVPSAIDRVVVRARALSGSYKDGEQVAIAVLPSSTPVIDSSTFYSKPNEEEYTFKLKNLPENGTSTFTYCDNPIWDCLLSLPALSEGASEDAISLAYAVYGNTLTNGLLTRYPNLREALKEASESGDRDRLLRGRLEQNENLKVVGLINTPWLRNARTETRRIEALTRYLNSGEAEMAIAAVADKLGKLQGSDGGWSWCAGMPGSVFITQRVLASLSPLRDHGFMTPAMDAMAAKAIGFIDLEMEKEWKRTGPAKYNYTGALDYFYIRSHFGVKESGTVRAIKAATVSQLAKDWKKLDIEKKAIAAIFIAEEGNKPLSRMIVESLSQYASSNPEKGVWYANLKSRESSESTILTTTRVLEAFMKVAPEAKEVEGLRQYLLLAKQTLDWGENRALAQTVATLLDGKTDWHTLSDSLSISVDGRDISLDEVEKISGMVKIDLKSTAKEIQIRRRANSPAWGGVISQYVAPILKVNEKGSGELKISKAVYAVTTDSKGVITTAGDLKVGDKVRVTLTVTSDRDLDYVTIKDNRAACLEPSDQVSGYAESDGIWMYGEIRNESTNLFIPFLPKGSHVISYDCNVDRAGEYSLGIATAQSLYAPQITAHSAGNLLETDH
ncbi:MAG: hypothetical protein K2M59_08835 [Muribaculaceae bacterium]|nr:hypothetical protein [Muribaculaceae bacterium]